MNKLLARIVEAHGGLDRWRRFNRIEAAIVTAGAFWRPASRPTLFLGPTGWTRNCIKWPWPP